MSTAKIGYIYVIENNFDEKVYIGRTIKPINERFQQHKHSALTRPSCILHKFMAIHGPENFTIKELRRVEYNSIIELDLVEEECIRDFGSLNTTYNSSCYKMGNLTTKAIAKERKPKIKTKYKQVILPSSEDIIKIAFENTKNDEILSINKFLYLFLDEETIVSKSIDEKVVNGKLYVCTLLLEWLGYAGPKELQKQAFLNLLDRNKIEYMSIDYLDPLVQKFPEIIEEISKMIPMHKARKRWILMDTKNFKKAIMKLNTKRRDDIQEYYLLLEELVQLYGAYTYQFKENQLKVQLQEKEDHILLLKDLLIDDQKREKTQVIYIATSCNYARQNRFKPGGVESADKLASRFSTYNSRSAAGDEWYYSDTFLVADYRQIENRLKDLLGRFRDKKGKEIYIMHYTNIRYIVEYLCTHYNDEVDEVNTKLAEFISNLNCHCLRPVVPPPSQVTYANITTLKEDGTTTNTTLSANSRKDFIDQLKEYVSGLDSDTTEITKKKVFDDLKVKKDRKNKFPLLRAILSELRPDILLKQKEA